MASLKTARVVIVGAGAAGLMAADHLSHLRCDLKIILVDAMPSPARKILMAGKSGLNISHIEGIKHPGEFAERYGTASEWMAPLLEDFGTEQVIDWMKGLGQTVFTGSSGRIFPDCMKASPLLRKLMHRLDFRGVELVTRHRWIGWTDAGNLEFTGPSGLREMKADATLLAMGGPSWPRLGTDGHFLEILTQQGLGVTPYKPCNCGFDADWQFRFGQEWSGHPIKSVMLSFGSMSVPGDFVITRNGIEGGPVYTLSSSLREAIEMNGEATLHVDLRPHQSYQTIVSKLAQSRGKQSFSNHLRKSINMRGVQYALLKACTDRTLMEDAEKLARKV